MERGYWNSERFQLRLLLIGAVVFLLLVGSASPVVTFAPLPRPTLDPGAPSGGGDKEDKGPPRQAVVRGEVVNWGYRNEPDVKLSLGDGGRELTRVTSDDGRYLFGPLGGGLAILLPVTSKSLIGPMPDLVVQSIQVIPLSPVVGSPAEIRVVISNAGPVEVNAPFWVDLYVSDSPIPTPSVNQAWNDLVSYGAAWHVYGSIPPGGTRILTNLWPNDLDNPDPNQRCSNYSNFTPSKVGGCPVKPPYPWPEWRWNRVPNSNRFPHSGTWYIKILVDSYSEVGSGLGEITETDETNNVRNLPTVWVSGGH
jgi:hypothetical protein